MADADITLAAKVCCTCRSELPAALFYKDKRTKDGLYARCKTCHNKATAAYAAKDPARANAMAKAWRDSNRDRRKIIDSRARQKKLAQDPDCERRRAKEYRAENLERVKSYEAKARSKRAVTHAFENKRYAADYYERHADAIKERAKNRYYERKEVDRPLVAERVMRRNARKLQATPVWANRDAIKAAYKKAASMSLESGIPYHVDHIVPLQSKHVCGLHVEFNLQVKPRAENMKKSNRWWPDCPDHIFDALPVEVRAALTC